MVKLNLVNILDGKKLWKVQAKMIIIVSQGSTRALKKPWLDFSRVEKCLSVQCYVVILTSFSWWTFDIMVIFIIDNISTCDLNIL